MFKMKIIASYRVKDVVLLGGKPEFDEIPKQIKIDDKVFEVAGRTYSIKPPFMGLEIKNCTFNKDWFINKIVTNYD